MSAALYATFGSAPPVATDPERSLDVATLVDVAVTHGDEHAIKVTEACLTRNALAPDPAYLAAAASALRLLPAAA